jgi:hypothetical protein
MILPKSELDFEKEKLTNLKIMAMPDVLSFPFLIKERKKGIFAYKLQIFIRSATECTIASLSRLRFCCRLSRHAALSEALQ